MKRFFVFCLLLLLISSAAFAETMTLTTYYPAPFGSYDRLRLVPRTIPPLCSASLRGTMYYDDTLNGLLVCQGDGASASWGFLQGIWTQDDTDNVYLTDTPVNSNLRVGIGTTAPESLLHLSGESPSLYIKGTSGSDYSATLRLAGEPNDNWRGGYMQYDASNGWLIFGVHDANNKSTASDQEVILINRSNGNIGIARPPSGYKLDVHGTIHADGADLAENFLVEGEVEPGDVVVISDDIDRTLRRSLKAYDTKVAGVISTEPGLCLGTKDNVRSQPLALTGQVPCKVTAENGPIKKGDLLTSSSKAGYAMRAEFIPLEGIENISDLTTALEKNRKRQLAVIGKALEDFDGEEGKIVILLTR